MPTAYLLQRNKKKADAEEMDLELPKRHELLVAVPVPAGIGLPKSVGGLVVSAELSKIKREKVYAFGDHASLKVALVEKGVVTEPVVSGPAYEGEIVPYELVKFADSASSKQTRSSKLGGLPFHFNEPSELPTCDECDENLIWAAHLAGDLFDEALGDSASLYIYVCPEGCQAKSAVDSA